MGTEMSFEQPCWVLSVTAKLCYIMCIVRLSCNFAVPDIPREW